MDEGSEAAGPHAHVAIRWKVLTRWDGNVTLLEAQTIEEARSWALEHRRQEPQAAGRSWLALEVLRCYETPCRWDPPKMPSTGKPVGTFTMSPAAYRLLREEARRVERARKASS
jgi:hypothetical protein